MNQHKIVGMSIPETKKLEGYVKKSKNVLEWGSGGSTLYFPQFVEKYVSIEHNKTWADKIRNKVSKNVEYYYTPIHEFRLDEEFDKASPVLLKNNRFNIKKGIYYSNTRGKFDWHCGLNYIKKPRELGYKYDLIFIDGRCRAFCAYEALKHLNSDGIVAIHDFNNRKYYHGVLDFYNVIDKEDTLVILKPKDNG